KTPAEARQLISSMAKNSQQFGTRGPTVAIQAVTKSEVSVMRSEMSELTKLVRSLCLGQAQVRACGHCSMTNHTIKACLEIQEGGELKFCWWIQWKQKVIQLIQQYIQSKMERPSKLYLWKPTKATRVQAKPSFNFIYFRYVF
ncbi:MAG: hypothetical protein Q8835_02555, partial [Sweet potato little leaf phytoplasma]|nr:hypothetical protein [Sweet potato little leaf phytoplasma]